MTSGHPILADICYALGSVLFVTKFLTWEENKQQAPTKRRAVSGIGVAVTVLLLVLAVWGTGKLNPPTVTSVPPTLEETLEKQRAEVLKDIIITTYVPSGDIWASMFTATNNSSYDIVLKKFGVAPRLMITSYAPTGRPVIVEGNGMNFQNILLDGSTIKGGGDSASLPLLVLRRFYPAGDLKCADITVSFQYELKSQLGVPQEKRVRMAMDRSAGLTWFPQPMDYSHPFCVKPPNAP
jgi:hypothetical protein